MNKLTTVDLESVTGGAFCRRIGANTTSCFNNLVQFGPDVMPRGVMNFNAPLIKVPFGGRVVGALFGSWR